MLVRTGWPIGWQADCIVCTYIHPVVQPVVVYTELKSQCEERRTKIRSCGLFGAIDRFSRSPQLNVNNGL